MKLAPARRLAARAELMALVLVFLALRPGVAGSAQSSSKTGAISGAVSEAVTARPLSEVPVSLVNGALRISRTTITDSKGRYVFDELPAADGYVMTVDEPGFVAGGLTSRPAFATGVRFVLAEGQWIGDANIVMWPLGGISGTVVDERTEPIVDAPVRVLVRVPIAGTLQWATGPAARTDDRGFYRIGGLRRGAYIVNVPSVQSVVPRSTPVNVVLGMSEAQMAKRTAPPNVAGLDVGGSWLVTGQYPTPPPLAGRLRAYPLQYYPDALSLQTATPVELADGEQKNNVDFMMRPVSTSSVSGRVVGPSDASAGLVLRLMPDGSESLGPGSEQATALVGPGGAFTFVGVPAGTYTLDARTSISELGAGFGPGALPATPGVVGQVAFVTLPSALGRTVFRTVQASARHAYSAQVPVVVGTDDVGNIEVVLTRLATIRGRIVRDGGGVLPSPIRVFAEPASGDPSLGGSSIDRRADQNPNAAFSIEGLHGGEYFVRVFAPGHVVKSIVAGADHTYRPFEVRPGTDIADVVVTLTDEASMLSGTVRDRSGVPISEAAVILFPSEPRQRTNFGLVPPRIRIVTAFGQQGFMITSVPAGDYCVIAVDSGIQDAWREPGFLDAVAPAATRVTLRWGTPALIDLTLQRVRVRKEITGAIRLR